MFYLCHRHKKLYFFFVMCLNDVIRKLLHKISLLADAVAFFLNAIELAC